MSLHVDMSEDAQAAFKRQKRMNIISAWVIALLSFILLALVFVMAKIYVMGPIQSEFVVFNAPPSQVETVVPDEVQTHSQQQKVSPAVTPVLTSVAVSEVVIPQVDIEMDVPVMGLPSLEIGEVSLDGGESSGIEGGGFGGVTRSGSSLVGKFYDTKQTKGGKPTNLSQEEFLKLLNNFVTKGWNENVFARFYRSPTELYISHFYVSKSDAGAAPKAFQCPDTVKGSRWVAVYRGKVVAPVTGKFRFVGYGDDALVVRFDGKNVLDYGWFQIGLEAQTATPEWRSAMKGEAGNAEMKMRLRKSGINPVPMSFYPYSSTPHWNATIGGMGGGQVFFVEEGKVYPIEVLVSEIPGGAFGMCLLMEEVGDKDAKKDKETGTPILNLFRTNFSVPGEEQKRDNPVPYLEESYIWRVVP